MAGKPLNRLELRRQSDAAEPLDPMEDEADEIVEDADDDDAGEKKPKKKAKAPAKSKAKAVKAVKPAARMRIVWTVMSDVFKVMGSFDYANKEGADARVAELNARGKGTHFVMKTKEPMPDDAPGLGAAIPRPEVAVVPIAAVKEAIAAAEDEEEIEDDEEAESESEPDDDDDSDPDAD